MQADIPIKLTPSKGIIIDVSLRTNTFIGNTVESDAFAESVHGHIVARNAFFAVIVPGIYFAEFYVTGAIG